MSVKGNYENFDIQIGQPQNGRYPVRVVYSPAGESPEDVWQSLPNDEDFADQAYYLRELLASPADAEQLGRQLRDFLFPDPIHDLYQRSRDRARAERKVGLRLRLRIQANTPELSLLPWEYCWYDGSFLTLDSEMPLVRYIPTPQAIRPLAMPEQLRVLLVTANPLDDLDVMDEAQHVIAAVSPLQDTGRLLLQPLHRATKPALSEAIQHFNPHVLHFMGHGSLTEAGEGVLVLHGANGEEDFITSQELKLLLSGGDIRLAILSACQSAQVTPDAPLLGLASQLVWAGLPAVIGMQFAVPDEAAVEFNKVLYRRLADEQALDTAIAQARTALYVNNKDKTYWGIPALFMRAPNGRLWQPPTVDVINYYLQGTQTYLPQFTTGIKNFITSYLGSEREPIPFGGRDEQLHKLEQWRTQGETQRLILAAPAGRGKSALLVRWSQQLTMQEDVAVLFMPISIRFNTNREEVTFAILATRLAHLYGREIPTNYANFTPQLWRDLVAQYLQNPLPDGRQLLLIIDGLDEAAWKVRADMFPFSLPEMTRIVVSARYLVLQRDFESPDMG